MKENYFVKKLREAQERKAANQNDKEVLPDADPADVRRKFLQLHNSKRDEFEEKKYQALKAHPAVRQFASKSRIEEAFLKAAKRDSTPGAGEQDMTVQSTKQDKGSSPGYGQFGDGGMVPPDKKKKNKDGPIGPMTPRE